MGKDSKVEETGLKRKSSDDEVANKKAKHSKEPLDDENARIIDIGDESKQSIDVIREKCGLNRLNVYVKVKNMRKIYRAMKKIEKKLQKKEAKARAEKEAQEKLENENLKEAPEKTFSLF